MASSSSNVVGVHYRVGKKIGEGSFGVIFEGTNLLNNQQVAIKFVRRPLSPQGTATSPFSVCPMADETRNLARATLPSSAMNIGRTRSWLGAVSATPSL